MKIFHPPDTDSVPTHFIVDVECRIVTKMNLAGKSSFLVSERGPIEVAQFRK
jgi:hypothetical protein